MLIKCEHCIEKCKDNAGICDCIAGVPKHKYAYRYRLADQLHRAVLDSLLDPKNIVKGEFSKSLHELWGDYIDEEVELKTEIVHGDTQGNGRSYWPPYKNTHRIIEECGDVGAYLSAIIDAVREE